MKRALILAICFIISSALCYAEGDTPSNPQHNSPSFEQRLRAIYPVYRDIFGTDFTEEGYYDLSRSKDAELDVTSRESTAAAWQRLTADHHLTKKQRFIYLMILTEPGFSDADLTNYCATTKPENLECVSTNDLAAFDSLLSDEGRKRGMKWSDGSKFQWIKAQPPPAPRTRSPERQTEL